MKFYIVSVELIFILIFFVDFCKKVFTIVDVLYQTSSLCYLVMVALCNRADHYIFMLFLLSSFFFYFLA